MISSQDIKFSIIMPTYNRGFCISKTIDSALAQTHKNFELLIIDDGSNDSTTNIVKQNYAPFIKNKQIIYIKLPHKGVCHARNHGLKIARYDWISYLDSDNTMHPQFLETFAQAIVSNNDKKWFYAQIQNINDKNIIGKPFSISDLRQGNYIDLGAVVHHHSLTRKLGGFDKHLKRLVDYELILRFSKKYPPHFIDKVVLNYNDNQNISRISNQQCLIKASDYIRKKHSLILTNKHNLAKGNPMKLFLLKISRLFHLISKKKYSEKRAIELISSSKLFDRKWYLSQNPDVKSKKIGAAKHYFKYGWKEGRNPSPQFDGNTYLLNNPDVKQSGINPLVHYILNGAKEGRTFVGINIPSSNSGLQHMHISLSQKIKDILSYPERIKTEYDRLNEEIKTLEGK